MAITLDVLARPDDRSFKQAADQAQRTFTKAGKDAGASFGKSYAQGVQSSAPQVQKAYDKVADAIGKVRVEQAKLESLEKSGSATRAQKIAQAERLDKAMRDQARSIVSAKDATVKFNSSAQESISRMSALRNLATGLAEGSGFGGMASSIGAATSRLGSFATAGAGAAAGVAGIAVAVGAAVKALYDLGSQWDSVTDSIIMRTGKVGDELDGITDSIKRVAQNTAAPIGTIGNITGQVVQSMKLSGGELDAMSQRLAILGEAGNGVGVRELARAFNVFGIDAKDQVKTLDDLFNVSRNTGIPLQELVTTLNSAGRATKQFGMDAGQTAALLASFEQGGLDASKTTQALTFAFKTMAKDGRDAATTLPQVIQQIQNLSDAHRDSEAAALAVATFGGKSYLDMLSAIADHRIDVDQLSQSFNQNGESITDAAERTEDLSEEWTKFTNTLSGTFEPVAARVFGGVNWMLQAVISNTRAWGDVLGDVFSKLSNGLPLVGGLPETGQLTPGGGVANAQRARRGLPPVDPTGGLLGVGGGDPALSEVVPIPGFTGTHLGAGGDFSGILPPIGWGRQESGGSGGRGGGAGAWKPPVFPESQWQVSLPAFASGPGDIADPQKVYEAQSSLLSAKNSVEQNRLRLLELEAKGDATQAEMIAARNNVVESERALQTAEAKVVEAHQGSVEKLKGSMDELGVALDKDFGISKGLPGLAENIVKFLASLAAAPVLGALQGVKSAYDPDGKSGRGLFGIVDSMFAKPGGGSGGGSGGSVVAGGYYPGDAALLSAVPAGRYEQTQNADLTKGLGDCSSSVEDLVQLLDGEPTFGRTMTTHNAAEWLTSRGFMPGTMPGAFNVGFNDDHMQATLPGGTPFNWGGQSSAANRGVGGSGAFDPEFKSHYYRPVGSGGGVSTSASSSPSSSGGWLPLTPEQLTNPGLTTPVAGSPGQGYPMPWNLGGPGTTTYGGPTGLGASVAGAPRIGGPAGRKPTEHGGAGIGIGGGILGAAMSAIPTAVGAAATAGSVAGGGGGAGGGAAASAAQIGIDEINRAIGAGAQLAGIGVEGLMQTFLPNESPLADIGNSWFGRIASAVAGAGVQIPNMAAQLAEGMQGGNTVDQAAPPNPNDPNAQPGSGQQAGTTINNNVNYTNNQATEDRAGADLTRHLTAQYTAPGPRQ